MKIAPWKFVPQKIVLGKNALQKTDPRKLAPHKIPPPPLGTRLCGVAVAVSFVQSVAEIFDCAVE